MNLLLEQIIIKKALNEIVNVSSHFIGNEWLLSQPHSSTPSTPQQ